MWCCGVLQELDLMRCQQNTFSSHTGETNPYNKRSFPAWLGQTSRPEKLNQEFTFENYLIWRSFCQEDPTFQWKPCCTHPWWWYDHIRYFKYIIYIIYVLMRSTSAHCKTKHTHTPILNKCATNIFTKLLRVHWERIEAQFSGSTTAQRQPRRWNTNRAFYGFYNIIYNLKFPLHRVGLSARQEY